MATVTISEYATYCKYSTTDSWNFYDGGVAIGQAGTRSYCFMVGITTDAPLARVSMAFNCHSNTSNASTSIKYKVFTSKSAATTFMNTVPWAQGTGGQDGSATLNGTKNYTNLVSVSGAGKMNGTFYVLFWGTGYFQGIGYSWTDVAWLDGWGSPTSYTISYNANGGSSTPTATTATAIDTYTLTYTQSNWLLNNTTTSYAGGASYTPTANATFYANWGTPTKTLSSSTYPTVSLAPAINKARTKAGTYTVTFDSQGGSACAALSADYYQTYAFTGWNTKADGSGTNYAASATYTPSANITLYAKWANGSQEADNITLPTPTQANRVFLGWSTSSTSQTGMSGTYTPTGNVKLYAIWGMSLGQIACIKDGTKFSYYQTYIRTNSTTWSLHNANVYESG